MEAFHRYIRQFPQYTPQAFAEALPLLASKQLKAGDYLLRETQVCKEVALVEKGILRLYYLHEGKEITKCFCKENAIVTAYSSLVSQQASAFAIQAIEDTQLIVLSAEALQSLYAKNAFWQQLGRMAGEQEYHFTECHHRFIQDLSATDRYVQILEKEPDLLQRVPLNYLASYLQIAPETLSRIRKKITRT